MNVIKINKKQDKKLTWGSVHLIVIVSFLFLSLSPWLLSLYVKVCVVVVEVSYTLVMERGDMPRCQKIHNRYYKVWPQGNGHLAQLVTVLSSATTRLRVQFPLLTYLFQFFNKYSEWLNPIGIRSDWKNKNGWYISQNSVWVSPIRFR